MRSRNAGVALLEVMVALAILAASGVALAAVASAGLRSEAVARVRERTLATEDRVLAALTLLSRQDLDRRLGRHPLGAFVVDVERPERTLYRLALADTIAPEVEALVTVVYRRDGRSAP